ncbi:MAG: COG1470 family protein [Thermoplasmatota archaeon]
MVGAGVIGSTGSTVTRPANGSGPPRRAQSIAGASIPTASMPHPSRTHVSISPAAVIILVGFLLASPLTTAAQAASASCTAPILILPPGPRVLSAGGSETVDVYVENDNMIEVAIVLNATVPAGWTAVFDSNHFSLGPRTVSQGNATVRKLTLLAPTQATGAPPGDVVVSARAACAGDGVSPAAVAQVQVELASPSLFLIALAAIAVLAIALGATIWRIRIARGMVRLASPDLFREVPAGHAVSLRVHVENLRNKPERVGLRVEGVPLGWTAFLPLHELRLEPGEAKELWLLVRPPPYVASGTEARLTLRAAPRHAGPVAPLSLVVRVGSPPPAGPTSGNAG